MEMKVFEVFIPYMSMVAILEKIVNKHTFNFCRDNSILIALQSGFVPGDSTVNQRVDLILSAKLLMKVKKKEVCSVLCDISKAFDRVWHRGLLYKLKGKY